MRALLEERSSNTAIPRMEGETEYVSPTFVVEGIARSVFGSSSGGGDSNGQGMYVAVPDFMDTAYIPWSEEYVPPAFSLGSIAQNNFRLNG